MSIRSFCHRHLKIGGHKWLPTVQESIFDPLDGGKEISYRAIRKCSLCRCVEKDWRVVGAATESYQPARGTAGATADWQFSLVGLMLKPLAVVALLVLLLVSGAALSIQTVRGFFGVA